jgi:SAM-dependent methyltransferase
LPEKYVRIAKMAGIKKFVRKVLPRAIVRAIDEYRTNKKLESFAGLSTQEVFTKVYEEGAWGKSRDPSQIYFSGSGSHDTLAVSEYIGAVIELLRSLRSKPDVVDLGCGDFSVGSKLRPFCERYVACDIVEPLIAFNKVRFKSMDVDFRILDLTRDQLPAADIVFVRQVLQHLSNEKIQNALAELKAKYSYMVLTEHLPNKHSFPHNVDKPTGPGIRLDFNSGIVLTSPPFNLLAIEERILCQIPQDDGMLRTTLYKLKAD